MRSSIKQPLFSGVLILLISLSISGCKTVQPTEPRIEYRTASVAVSVGCVVNKPGAPAPLNQQIGQSGWDVLAPGAKAQAVLAQAGDRMNYEDALRASTDGCRPAPPASIRR